jgi:hypothetical protein
MSLKIFILLIFNTKLICYCQTKERKYPEIVGEIQFDSLMDNKSFQLCNENVIGQNFGWDMPIYKGEKPALLNEFKRKFSSREMMGETGIIRIRFLVNCRGESDRFRIIGMDENHNEKVFSPLIVDQLLQITKGLTKWNIYKINDVNYDYYNYLLFKFRNGYLIEILP